MLRIVENYDVSYTDNYNHIYSSWCSCQLSTALLSNFKIKKLRVGILELGVHDTPIYGCVL